MQREFPVTRILVELERDSLLPAILFRTARKQCDADLEALAGYRKGLLNPTAEYELRQAVKDIIAKYSLQEEVIYAHEHFEILVTKGVGAHHAGHLLAWRLLLEELMSKGVLRMLVATGTVAAGVDFPARSVVITSHSKRGSEGFNVLSSSEFQQMSGRAGRRGKDAVGLCIIAPGVYSDARVINELVKRPPEPLKSVYFAAPATVLNLLKHRNVDDLRYTVERSLASFHDRRDAKLLRESVATEKNENKQKNEDQIDKKTLKKIKRLEKEAEALETKQVRILNESLEGLERLGYVEKGSLTEKGLWSAEMCTSLVLELAECINEGILYDQSPEILAGLVGALAGDPHRTYFRLKANPIKKEYYRKLEKVISHIKESYQNPFTQEVHVLPDASVTVITWMECETWSQFSSLIRLAGIADGDVARLINQTADHLNQISRLIKTHPPLAESAMIARKRLLRPPFSDLEIV